MRSWYWIAAIVSACVLTLTSINAYVYPRNEAVKLESQVNQLHKMHREDIKQIKDELIRLNEWLRGN